MNPAEPDLSRPSPFGAVLGRAQLRQTPEDFQVTEIGQISPSGAGEHVWLWVRKRGENTEWVARQLAKLAGVRARDVSYAGLKDRWAVTEQWFSVHLPGRADPDWALLNSDSINVLQATRHDRKLRRGVLQGNRFQIVLSDVTAAPEDLATRVEQLKAAGWPNYFGEQRFGHRAGNLQLARDLITGKTRKLPRHKRSLAISATRSFLFNLILAERVRQGNWNRIVDGDVLQLDGRSALFAFDPTDETLEERLQTFAVHPTAPLWGRGENMARGTCAVIESDVLKEYTFWTKGLEKLGAQLDRRALRVRPQDLQLVPLADDAIRLDFTLPAGSYATVLIEQLVEPSAAP